MTTSAILNLDREAWSHVAVALTRHRSDLERNGQRLPASVRDLLEAALDIARNEARKGQERSDVDGVADLLDAVRVGVLLTTIPGAATALGVSDSTVKRLVASGQLPAVSVGGSRRIRTADLHTFVESLGEDPHVDAC